LHWAALLGEFRVHDSSRLFLFEPDATNAEHSQHGAGERDPMKSTIKLALLLLALGRVSTAFAAPSYSIVALGLDDLEHTRDDGYKDSFAFRLNEAGQAVGRSERYNGGSTSLGQSVWFYDGATTFNIGLTGAEHTRDDGYKNSFENGLNDAGQVVGRSERYDGGNTFLGESVWLYDGATTMDIGLTGLEHTRNTGFKSSNPRQLNGAGQVMGTSERYNGGGTYLGESAWLYDGTTTIDIGLIGPEHTRSTGSRFSEPRQLNEAGQVVGRSDRFNGGSTFLGLSAWLFDGTTTIDIGLTGTEHTSTGGVRNSFSRSLNEAGQVIGISARFNGGVTFGNSAWLYDGATTIQIGLTGPEHTRGDGFKQSITSFLNEAGQVAGTSLRFVATSIGSGSAWLYDGATTREIGLTGAEHTRDDGFRSSGVAGLNEAGQVIGTSNRFLGPTYLGSSAWLFDGAATFEIGLTGAEHTDDDGFRYSQSFKVNEAGQVRGHSERYNGGSTYLGVNAWLFDGADTVAIGLTGAEHTRNDGYKFSESHGMNEVGQVIGSSERYNGGSALLGQDAWFYDPLLQQTFSLSLSTRSDGVAFSSVNYLGDDGLALGYYQLFDAFDNSLGYRAFYFTVAGGLHDLGSLVEGGLSANGWDYLASAVRENSRGQIIGGGKLTSPSGDQMPYLLTPVPEPSAFFLWAFGALGLLTCRRFYNRSEQRHALLEM
jgi:hypothetical protein